MAKRKNGRQGELALRGRGGARRGAGRRSTRPSGAGVSHSIRPALTGREPVLVTLKVRREVSRLRGRRAMARLIAALAAAREGLLRIAHFSVQHDHLHLIVEAQDKSALARGVQGLAVRIARALNKLMERSGTVFADRHHTRVLASPRQVRFALRYVLLNAHKHAEALPSRGLDPCSSAAAFDGWAGRVVVSTHALARAAAAVAVEAKTWLLRIGWRRGGPLLDPDDRPGPLPA